MATLREDVAACRARFADAGVEALLAALCGAAARHADELPDDCVTVCLRVTGGGAYVLTLAGRGLTCVGDAGARTTADVTIEGAERVLVDLFMKRLSPVKAVLLRRIRVAGDVGKLKVLEGFF